MAEMRGKRKEELASVMRDNFVKLFLKNAKGKRL
jgi:hypothetical protein